MVALLPDIDVNKRAGHDLWHNNECTASMEELVELTERIIRATFSTPLAHSILMDEDAVNFFCSYLIESTCRFDASRGMKLYSYQVYCIKQAAKRWLRLSKQNRQLFSLQEPPEEGSKKQLYSTLVDEKSKSGDEVSVYTETVNGIRQMFKTASLSAPQRRCLYMQFFEEKTQAEIARELKISREAVRINVNRGLANLKDQYEAVLYV